jgi:hypothetical protein
MTWDRVRRDGIWLRAEAAANTPMCVLTEAALGDGQSAAIIRVPPHWQRAPMQTYHPAMLRLALLRQSGRGWEMCTLGEAPVRPPTKKKRRRRP